MKLEIRHVEKTENGIQSYPMDQPFKEEWEFGLYYRDEEGLQWHISDHDDLVVALDAQTELIRSLCETTAVLSSWLLAWYPPSDLAVRFRDIDGDSASRLYKVIDLAEAFEIKHFGFLWGEQTLLPDGTEPPFGSEWREAVDRCVNAFEAAQFEIPVQLL
jgi:hypothetical protein